MSEAEVTKNAEDVSHGSRAILLQQTLPYVAVLTLAVVGVAYTNISHQPLTRYWEFLALATGVFCVVTEWGHAKDRPARFRLLWTQALHWVAILVTMNIVLLCGVRQMSPAPAISLVLLTLLALGTFLAGVNFLSLRISFLGLALALAVPAIAWFTKSALFLVLAAIFVIGLGLAMAAADLQARRR
jgi:hypothetical protein